MTSKRIRCACGRIYDPVKHTQCPDCGAATVVAAAEPPPLPEQNPAAVESTSRVSKTESRSAQPATTINPRLIAMAAGALVLLIVIGFSLARSGKKAEVSKQERSASAPTPAASAAPSTAPTGGILPPQTGPESDDLAGMIARAAPGATVKVPAGLYRGGLVVTRAVRIVADSRAGGQVFIQSDGKECLSVRSSGVAVQNVQFLCNGIGELPAISVADGADLDLDACKVQSMTAVGVALVGKASIKALGSTFTAVNGTAVRLQQGAHASFTQCAFTDGKVGLAVVSAATTELHSCAFERNTGSDAGGGIIAVRGAKSAVTADDCHFTDNRASIGVIDSASVALTNSTFKGNGISAGRGAAATAAVVAIAGQGSTATIAKTSLTNSTSYAISVFSGANLTLDEVEISGTRNAGLLVGDRNGPSARAEVKRSHFNHNGAGIGVVGGSSASVEESECMENEDGVVALDPKSQLKLVKTTLASNRDFGIYVHSNAQADVIDCDIRNNGHGAQSGTARKSSERASLALDNCRFGGNRIYAAGACTQSELILTACVFDGTDKTNVYKERGAIVRTDAVAETSASPSPESAEPQKSDTGEVRRKRKPSSKDRRRSDDDLYKMIRRFRP